MLVLVPVVHPLFDRVFASNALRSYAKGDGQQLAKASAANMSGGKNPLEITAR